MEHPQITDTERFGSLWNTQPPDFVGECAFKNCKLKKVFDNYEYCTDSFGNIFCCKEHAEAFYGIKEIY